VTTDGAALQDVTAMIKTANGTFVELYPLWENKNILMEMKTHIFKSNVKSVQMDGCKTWKVTIQITEKFQILLIDVCEEKLG
jgi:hypothetical protein